MESANLGLVRSIYAGWERGDWSSSAWSHPDVEFAIVGRPSPGIWKGREGLAEGMRDVLRAWMDYRAEAEAYRELDGERVLVLHRRGGRGRSSGIDIEQLHSKGATVFDIRDGKVTRFVGYLDRDQAFADLGLAPEGDTR